MFRLKLAIFRVYKRLLGKKDKAHHLQAMQAMQAKRVLGELGFLHFLTSVLYGGRLLT
jgi:hypothetical protein